MRLTSRLFQRIAFAVVLGVFGAWAQTDGVWLGVTPQWSNPANWENGVVPGNGGSAVFKGDVGVSLSVSNDVPGLVLGGLSFSSNVTWVLQSGYPITLAADVGTTNTVHVERNHVDLRSLIGPGAGVLRKTGAGYLNFTNTASPFNGSWLVEQDRLEIKTGTSLVAEPAVYRSDALIMNGGAIKNNDSSPVFPPTLGITLLERGGSFAIGWHESRTLTFASPITGPGALCLSQNNGRFLLSNPTNDYAGGTVVGTNGPGYHGLAAAFSRARIAVSRLTCPASLSPLKRALTIAHFLRAPVFGDLAKRREKVDAEGTSAELSPALHSRRSGRTVADGADQAARGVEVPDESLAYERLAHRQPVARRAAVAGTSGSAHVILRAHCSQTATNPAVLLVEFPISSPTSLPGRAMTGCRSTTGPEGVDVAFSMRFCPFPRLFFRPYG